MTTPIQAVFFDLDDTLIDDYESTRLCTERTCFEFQNCVPGFDRTAVARTYEKVGRTFWLDDASRNLDDYSTRLPDIRTMNWTAALQACGISTPGLGAELAAFYGALRNQTVIAFEEVEQVLQSLHGKVQMAVITNGPGAVQRRKLAASGLDRYFDFVLACTDIDAAKPDAIVFQTALDALAVSPARAWHIGDNLHADVGGALNAGLSAAWLNRRGRTPAPEDATPTAEITDLRELLPLLR